MNELEQFTQKFTKERFADAMQLKRNFYIVPEQLQQMNKAIGREPFAIGTFLGSGKPFHPSSALLDWLGERTERFVMLDRKASWLFLCGRDIFPDSIVKQNAKEGAVLVKNQIGEILGYGEYTTTKNARNNKISIKNRFDRGDFLRRERH